MKSTKNRLGILASLCLFLAIFLIQAGCQAGSAEESSQASGSSVFDSTQSYAKGLDTVISVGPPLCAETVNASFKFKCKGGVTPCTYKCALDPTDPLDPATFVWAKCKASATFTALAEGSHTLYVKAKDSAGKSDKTPATQTWTVGIDSDGDTFSECSAPVADCNDADVDIHPGATEILCDGIDQNCNGAADDTRDLDADGSNNCLDCDDLDPAVHPGATEICNGIDDNCVGGIDEGVKTTFYGDADADGYGNILYTVQACSAPALYVADSTDCNDGNAAINPGVSEITCDGINNDCDALTLDDPDDDLDGASLCAATGNDCDDADPNNWIACLTCLDDDSDTYYVGCDAYATILGPDCNDGDANSWNPASCTDCADLDGDGSYDLCDAYATVSGPDCDDGDANSWNPASCADCADLDGDDSFDLCDAYDTVSGPDCNDGDANSWNPASCADCLDNDLDTYYANCDAYTTVLGPDCDDDPVTGPLINPAAAEITCNGIDENCNGLSDDDPDGDGDGVSFCPATGNDCDDTDPFNWVNCATCVDTDGDGVKGTACDIAEDCNDGDITIYPGATEICDDGIIQDCDRAADCACGDDVCELTEDAVTCAADCVCGDGICSGGEDSASCLADCFCGDGLCNIADEDATNCVDDCFCGDTICSVGEDEDTCIADCPATCGDTYCNPLQEDQGICPDDCWGDCGDNVCNKYNIDWDPAGETASTCPEDCEGCGDSLCNFSTGEDSGVFFCPSDCPGTCGDTFCSFAEDLAGCPADCWVCGDTFCTAGQEDTNTCLADCPVTCGDLICSVGETNATCAADCLVTCNDGLGTCDAGETPSNCPGDCP